MNIPAVVSNDEEATFENYAREQYGAFDEPSYSDLARLPEEHYDEFIKMLADLCVISYHRQWWMSLTTTARPLKSVGKLFRNKRLEDFPSTETEFNIWKRGDPDNDCFMVDGRVIDDVGE